MKNIFKRKKVPPKEPTVLSFLDCITPGVLKFETDHYISGNTWRCVWALREYPAATDSQALLGRLGDRRGVTLRIVCRLVTPAEENRIIHNATNRNKLERANTNDLRRVITAESNLQDMASLVGALDREHEPLLYCAVYVEVMADSFENLKLLQTSVEAELVRCKLTIDKLVLRQQQGFLTVNPAGYAALGPQFQRVLPASSVANLFPFNYSGKADPNGFYIGKDKFGSNIVVDFDRRESDKTSANILILGNSGQGKSYLMKLLICNLIESGKSVISLDAEHELGDLCGNLNGCFIDLMAGDRHINVLEVKCWDTAPEPDESAPEAFRKNTFLARHISFLKDFFKAYKDFSDAQLDTIEIMLTKLYAKWGISEHTDPRQLTATDYPILSDFYALLEEEYLHYNPDTHQLYTKELLQEGRTVAALDELYLWLSNPIAIEYIRNCLKRVRKRDSALMMASQNLEDFNQREVREMTKPLFAIPPHQFFFNPGTTEKQFFTNMLQMEDTEFDLISKAQNGECLFRCGSDRYMMKVIAPEHKAKLFGTKGGK